jgi:hypothetical protein
MPCNRKECRDRRPHVHLRPQDERAIAKVLLEMVVQRQLARNARRNVPKKG